MPYASNFLGNRQENLDTVFLRHTIPDMNALEAYFTGLPLDSYECIHPDRTRKRFCLEKIPTVCMVVAGGEPCPFLAIMAASEGRPDEVGTRSTRRQRRRFPGE